MPVSHVPVISVLMSVFNGAEYLPETITSILNQTFDDFEFIIVNDGSQDNALEVIQHFQRKDARIVLIDNGTNLGLIKSLNAGLKIARGRYIARMDNEDIARRDRFRLQFDFLEHHRGVYLVGSHAINIDADGEKISLYKPPTDPETIQKTPPKTNCIYHNTIMFRNTGEYRYRRKMHYVEGYDLYLNMLTDGKRLANIPEFLVKYRRLTHTTSFSKKGIQELFAEQAKSFFRQRQRSGRDQYDTFNPRDILGLDIESSTDPVVLAAEVIVSFALADRARTRKFVLKYFKHHGVLKKPQFLLYFMATFLSDRTIKRLKRIMLRFLNRY